MITDIDQLDLSKQYSYSDYITWKLKERVELIRGWIFKMSPAPNVKHQKISTNLHRDMAWFLKNTNCQIFHAPFDVRLPLPEDQKTPEKIDTVVQPDICIICDDSKLDEQGCIGAPDLIVEILSPGNSKKEMKDKYTIYEQSGVLEYWVVFPSEEVLQRYLLVKGHYVAQHPNVQGDLVGISFLENFEMNVSEIFE